MQLEVTFRNLASRDEIRARAQLLFAKMDRFLDLAAEGHLLVATEQHDAICELIVTTRGRTFKARERNDDMRTAMDKAFHAIEEQLRRFKSRRTEHHPRGGVKESGFALPEQVEADV